MTAREPNEEQIQAWLAGQLGAEESRAVEEWMEKNADAEPGIALPEGMATTLKEKTQSSVAALISKIRAVNAEMQNGEPDWRSAVEPGGHGAGRLGDYEIIEKIAHGGMGIVLKAHDPKLDRVVALKLLSPDLAKDKQARERFLHEARAAAALEHDNVLPIYTVSDEAAVPYFAMRYAAGGNLQDSLKSGDSFGMERIRQIGMQVASALAAAHEAGIIHRDIKPANILFDDSGERVWVCDFGIAQSAGHTPGEGSISGTPEYMSPEQAEGRKVDERSDLFSLGSVLYRCAVGRDAFGAETTVSTLKSVTSGRRYESPGASFPKWFRDLLTCLHETDPEQRPKSAMDVVRIFKNESSPHPNRWKFLATAAAVLILVAWGSLQIPSVARSCNLAIAAASDRDVVFSGRFGTYRTVEEAVQKARAGDEILFTSKGPFPVSMVTIPEGKPLRFSAVAGVLPRIELGKEGRPGIITHSDLSLEQLTFANPFPRPNDPGILQVVGNCKLVIHQCYFSVSYTSIKRWAESPPAVIEVVGPANVQMTNTMMNTNDCRAFVLRGDEITAKISGSAQILIAQSCILCNQIFDFAKNDTDSVRVDFHQNLSLARVFLWKFAPASMPYEIDIRAKGNIFNQQRILNWFAGATKEEIQAGLVWKGENNLHRSTRPFLSNAPDPFRPRPTFEVATLAQWREFLREPLPDSSEVEFSKAYIDQLPPGLLRKNVADYMTQFGAANDRGPDSPNLGPSAW